MWYKIEGMKQTLLSGKSLHWLLPLLITTVVHVSYLNNNFMVFDFASLSGNPWINHFVSIVLQAAATLSVMFLSREYFKLSLKATSWVGIIFGIHPLSWLSVGLASYGVELLAIMFTSLAVGSYVRGRVRNNIVWWVLVVLAGGVALWVSPSAYVWLPGLVLVWEMTQPGFIPSQFGWIYLGVTMSLSEVIGVRLAVFTQRLTDLIVPGLPSLSNAVDILPWWETKPWITLMAFVMIGGWMIRQKRKDWIRWLGFLVVTLLPILTILPLDRIGTSHYGYFAVSAVGVGILMLLRFANQLERIVAFLILLIWVTTLAVSTFLGGFRFKDDVSLLVSEVTRDPQYRQGHYYLGNLYRNQGDYLMAETHYQSALVEMPKVIADVDAISAMMNLADVEIKLGKEYDAIGLWKQLSEVAEGANRQEAIYNLALFEFNKKNFAGAWYWLKLIADVDQLEIQNLKSSIFHYIGPQ